MRRTVTALLCLAFGCGPSTGSTDPPPGGADSGPPGCQGIGCLNFCPLGTMTTVTGTVTAPNGIDPVPGAIVYVPATIEEFPATVRCEVCSQITSAALVATQTAPDGSFTLGPLPTVRTPIAGDTITLIAQKGRFRRVAEVPIHRWCHENRDLDAYFRLPGRTQGRDQIPRIAVATGDYDMMECVLAKLGIETGAFDLYSAESGPRAYPGFDTLLRAPAKLQQYEIVFINCTGNVFEKLLEDVTIRSAILDYVASGGRLYVTDWSYDYVEQIEEWSGLIDFEPGASGAVPEPMSAASIGTHDITTEAAVLDPGLRRWLEAVEAKTGEEIIDPTGRVHIGYFLGGWAMQHAVPVMPDSRSMVWLEGLVTGIGVSGVRPLTTTFDHRDCGRVLFSSYHTREKVLGNLMNNVFPNYCPVGELLAPQERVLEYLIMHVADCIEVD